jgi:hypothetical protein
MEILITFPEIQELIKNKTGKETIFSMVDSKTIKVTYPINVKIPLLGQITKDVSLNVSIDEISGTDIRMTYDCGMAIEMMISGALKFIKEDPRLNFVGIGNSKQIILKLGEIDKIKSAFEKVEIEVINVAEAGIGAVCRLKDIR